MKPQSPHYRNDDMGRLDESIQAYLDAQYLPRITNLDKQNPKVIVVFSGGNAVGKTTLSRKIEKELGAVVIENDEIRRYLKDYLGTANASVLSPITWKYTNLLYGRLGEITENGLVVRDGVIDWYYDRLIPLFEKNGYRLFIIGYDLSDTKSRELIKRRGDTPTFKAERAYHLLDDHNIYIKRFREQYTPDILLNDDTVFDHDSVIEALRGKLSEVGAKRSRL
jgi:predicted kinase